MEDSWKWPITIIAGLVIWLYKIREQRAKALKAETEFNKIAEERRIENEARRIYPQVIHWLKEQKQGLNTRRPLSLEKLKKVFIIDEKAIERVWKLLIEDKHIAYKTDGFEGYYILPY